MTTFLLGFLNAFYIVFIVIFLAYILGNLIDSLFVKLFNKTKQDQDKSDLRLVIETAVQIGVTEGICYGFAKIIDNLPFPTNGNYKKIQIHDYDQGRILFATFVILFQPNLLSKFNILHSNMTLFD